MMQQREQSNEALRVSFLKSPDSDIYRLVFKLFNLDDTLNVTSLNLNRHAHQLARDRYRTMMRNSLLVFAAEDLIEVGTVFSFSVQTYPVEVCEVRLRYKTQSLLSSGIVLTLALLGTTYLHKFRPL